jgi:hypothetical protein
MIFVMEYCVVFRGAYALNSVFLNFNYLPRVWIMWMTFMFLVCSSFFSVFS